MKIKTGVDRLLLVSKLKKKINLKHNISENLFSLPKPKLVHLRPFLSFPPFLKFQKQHFMYFEHKYVETRPNCSYKNLSSLRSKIFTETKQKNILYYFLSYFSNFEKDILCTRRKIVQVILLNF